ncbi:hypothetical protein BS47DRAFT_1286696 [Hydnum rufescens UP504]|uniref:AB hydrolase-1 domain-containing protein n=1 Tax=Hydnum rufescens UP504 TaxID=1448309 RepID=A0A9P6BAU3_9AGAM|nr:hypothetical protein BS47DRAFT_1286696 [Hydnum rufescens UP504]
MASNIKPSREIPSTTLESFKFWWGSNDKAGAMSEDRLFSRLPFYTPSWDKNSTPSGDITASVSKVELSTPKRFLNTLSILPTLSDKDNSASAHTQAPVPSATVVLPGYGAGIGFFYLNFPSLASWVRRRRTPVYAVDWLGMGRSARVPFSVKAKREDNVGRATEAEAFFIDALEEWRIKQGLEQMALIGHSLGAYLSAAYALRYPDRVSRLILLSPCGIPQNKDAMDADSESNDSDSVNAPSIRSSSVDSATRQEIKNQRAAFKARRKDFAQNPNKVLRFFFWAWETGLSPFQFVRSTLFWGPMLVGRYSSRRFPHLPEEDVRDLHEYLWHITSAKGSGEYSISHILTPSIGAYARYPLVERIDKLKVPVTFVYGDHDWMDPEGGRESVKRLKAASNPDANIYVVKDAGHHVYLDNPSVVDELILRELDRVPQRPSTPV